MADDKHDDPIEELVEKICAQHGYRYGTGMSACVRDAVAAGIEMGRGEVEQGSDKEG